MSRRAWLATAGGLALAAGLAGQAWVSHRRAETAFLWSLKLETPGGQVLALESFRGQPLLLNFWATWCPPCLREMPALDLVAAEQARRGWRVLGLAVDNAGPVRELLSRQPVRYPVALVGAEGVALSRQLGNTQGGLPFTVLVGPDGRILRRRLGETTHAELTSWAE